MHKLKFLTISIILAMVLSLAGPLFNVAASPLAMATAPTLGALTSFSALADLAAASANMTTLSGDLGLSTNLAASRTGPWTVGGTEYFGPLTLAGTAHTDAYGPTGAWTTMGLQPSDGLWLLNPAPLPGVWTANASAVFAGPTLTLNGGPTDVWVFQITDDLTFTGAVILTGGAQACNVFWRVSRDATIALNSTFIGTLIAGRDITVVSGATVNGRVISGRNLTVDANTITGPTCRPSLTTTGSGPVTVGGYITDTANLAIQGGYSTLLGTLTYNVYAPGDTTCATPITLPLVGVAGGGNYTSPGYLASQAGTYRWRAIYSGDANNQGVTSACNEAGETSTVNKTTPTITTSLSSDRITVGDAVHDSAILLGASSNAGGTVIYSFYTDTACTLYVGTGGIRTVTNGVVQDSLSITFNIADSYYWQAAYSGDLNNNGVASPCASEKLGVVGSLATLIAISTPGAGAAALPAALPGTGFAPQHVTVLSAQPAEKAYADLGDLWLEIPKLGVQMPIVGVPQTNGEWDVSWLGNEAGWLNGSAFPTHAGNSVLTGHVWNADNTAGPFRYVNTLWWGDKVIVHAWGGQYVYEVRSVQQVSPTNTVAMLKHEKLPWITLVTCRGYDEASNSYKYRVLVRAVLMEVK